MLSSIMETIIFMFMGLSTVSDSHSWNTGFVFITLAACLVFRFIGKRTTDIHRSVSFLSSLFEVLPYSQI